MDRPTRPLVRRRTARLLPAVALLIAAGACGGADQPAANDSAGPGAPVADASGAPAHDPTARADTAPRAGGARDADAGGSGELPRTDTARAPATPDLAGEDDMEGHATPLPDSVVFRALGQEPGWLLDIVPGVHLHYVGNYGETERYTPVPRPMVEADGTVVYHAVTEQTDLRVRITPEPCSDIMSGRRFPNSVTVTVDGETYTGCGDDLPDPPPGR